MFYKEIVNENMDYIRNGFYKVKDEIHTIADDIKCSQSNTIIVEEIYDYIEHTNIQSYRVRDNIEKLGTIEGVLKLREKVKENTKIVVLNFASSESPGGDYLYGGVGQEESLCRASTLFEVLWKKRSENEYLYNFEYPLFDPYLIFSPKITIFRDEDGKILKSPLKIDVISSPAVNRYKALMRNSTIDIDIAMKERVDFILKFLSNKNYNYIVLWPFGCGAYGNSKRYVYKCFEESINKYIDLNKTSVKFFERSSINWKGIWKKLIKN